MHSLCINLAYLKIILLFVGILVKFRSVYFNHGVILYQCTLIIYLLLIYCQYVLFCLIIIINLFKYFEEKLR